MHNLIYQAGYPLASQRLLNIYYCILLYCIISTPCLKKRPIYGLL